MLTFPDILSARARLAPFVPVTPLRSYPSLDQVVGSGISVFVKHENHLPTNSFKYRNGLAAMTALSPGERARGVIATTLGNHGQGVAVAARMLGVKARIFVPLNNNPDKNAAIRGFGADLVSVRAIADALQTYLRCTHNLCEGAGAAGLAGLCALTSELAGQRVGLVLTGSNIDQATLAAVLAGAVAEPPARRD